MLRALCVLVTAAVSVCGCGNTPHRSIDTSEFEGATGNALLVDLHEVHATSAALLLQTRASQPELHVLAFPFSSVATAPDRQLLLASGTHGKMTILTVVAAPALPATSVVYLKPSFEEADESDFSRDDLKGSAYFLSLGLKRRFFYRTPSPKDLTSEPWQTLTGVTNTSLSHLVLRVPSGSDIFESPASSVAPEFMKESQKGRIRTYSYAKLSSAPIDLRYQLPPTKLQEQIFEYTIKLFIVLIAPLVALFAITSDKVRSAGTRTAVLVAGVAVEAIALAGLIWWAFYIQSVAGFGAILDVALAILGAVATIFLAAMKKKPSPGATADE